MDLVIMAAGMGSRFGGLKQIEPVGPNGEFIIDYSVYDAKRAGFTKVVFVIKKEIEEIFKETIGKRVENKIKVAYAFQEIEDIPSKKYLAEKRTKPWGTVQAVLCTKDYVDGDFAVINADDFNSFEVYEHFKRFHENSVDEYEYLSVNYPFYVTQSKYGAVKRGVCLVEDGYLTGTLESEIKNESGKLVAYPLDGSSPFPILETQPVTVNLFLFKKSFFEFLNRDWQEFIENGLTDSNEFMLPVVLRKALLNKEIKIKAETSHGTWLGMTYREDEENIKNTIKNMIEKGDYPAKHWD